MVITGSLSLPTLPLLEAVVEGFGGILDDDGLSRKKEESTPAL